MQTRFATRVTGAVHHIARSEGRLRARLMTRLEREGCADTAFTLRNVSASGFMGECAEGAEGACPLRAGSKVVLLLPLGGALAADVRWALNGRIGCQLRTRLTGTQRALVLALSLKNGLVSATALRAAVVVGALAVLALR